MTEQEREDKILQIFTEETFAQNIAFLEECAELGDVACAMKAGEVYVGKDLDKAERMFKIGADKDHLYCCKLLSEFYFEYRKNEYLGCCYLAKAIYCGHFVAAKEVAYLRISHKYYLHGQVFKEFVDSISIN